MDKENKPLRLKHIIKALIFIAEKLDSQKIDWLLGGSGALMVHGIEVVPWDLDILITKENINNILKIFKQYITNPDIDELTLTINDIDVEIITINDLGSPKPISFHSASIPVNALEEELTYYKDRVGKEEIIKLIEDKIIEKKQH